MKGIFLRLKARRGEVILVVSGVLAIVLLVWQLARAREPVYEGRPVSAWIKELSRTWGSFGIQVSGGGKGSPLWLLNAPSTNSLLVPPSLLYLPSIMLPKPGLTNVYIVEESPQAGRVVNALAQLGVLSITNTRVSIGSRSNVLLFQGPARGSSWYVMSDPPGTLGGIYGGGRNIALPGPLKPAPGLNLINVYDAFPTHDKSLRALQAIGAPALPYLEKALRNQNRPLRDVYLRLYSRLGSWGERRLPEPSADAVFTRRAAAGALAQMPMLGTSTSAALLAALNDTDDSVRSAAFWRLDKLSEQDPAILPAVTRAMTALPVSEFLSLGSTGPASIQVLITALNDRDANVRAEAVSRVGRIGPKAKVAIPALIARLQDEDRTVRARTCEALPLLQGEPAVVVPALIAALQDRDHWVRRNAAENLGLYKGEAKAAMPRLLELRDAANGVERYCVRKALKQIDPEAAGKAGII